MSNFLLVRHDYGGLQTLLEGTETLDFALISAERASRPAGVAKVIVTRKAGARFVAEAVGGKARMIDACTECPSWDVSPCSKCFGIGYVRNGKDRG